MATLHEPSIKTLEFAHRLFKNDNPWPNKAGLFWQSYRNRGVGKRPQVIREAKSKGHDYVHSRSDGFRSDGFNKKHHKMDCKTI